MKWLARGVAFSSGCSSLVVEILWVRIVGFAESGRPDVFAFVLGNYLIGIALGAFLGRKICYGPQSSVVGGLFWLLVASSFFDPLSIALFSGIAPEVGGYLASMPLLVAGAAMKGAVFPLVHHLGSNDQARWKGVSFSRVYAFNLLGCTVGPALVALVTLDYFSTRDHFLAVGALSGITALCVGWGFRGFVVLVFGCVFLFMLWWVPDPLRAMAFARPGESVVFWLENKRV